MALLAVWSVQEPPVDPTLIYTFHEAVRGDVEVRVTDQDGDWVPEYTESRVGDLLYAVGVMPEEDWIYPVKIKIRSNP